MRITESKIKHLPNCVYAQNHIKLAKSNGRILARLEKRRTSETETETETCADELGILWSILYVCVCACMCLVAVRHEQLVVPVAMCYFCLVPVHKQSVPPNLQLAGVCVHTYA